MEEELGNWYDITSAVPCPVAQSPLGVGSLEQLLEKKE